MSVNGGVNVLAVTLAAGESKKLTDGFGSAGLGFFFSPSLVVGSSLEVTFGVSGQPWPITLFSTGVFVRLDDLVSEITIRNTGAGAVSGHLIVSSCERFLVIGV